MRLFFKIAIVFFLTLAILIPLMLVHGTITERASYRQTAIQDVAGSYAGEQAITGPVLVVPYVETFEREETGPQGVRKVLRERKSQWTYFPDALSIDGTLVPDTRTRGLYRVPVYELGLRAHATLRAVIPSDADTIRPRRIGQPYLSIGLQDARGLVGSPKLAIDGRTVPLQGGFGSGDRGGVHARLTAPRAGDTLAFDIRFDATLGGTQSLAIVPIAKDNRFNLASAWPHPSFGGSFLPRTRTVGDTGFRARWEISSLATDAQSRFLANTPLPSVSVSMVDPVDVYVLADRATKYGILFVVLTFVGFFMFETIKQLPIHPIQYALVGLALAIFFLLLVSLSEHIPFGAAYVIAAVACIGLLGFYLSAVLRSATRGIGFAAMLALLYAALYGLLVSEDNALVLGAGLLFAILAAIMIVTRKVDWYALQHRGTMHAA